MSGCAVLCLLFPFTMGEAPGTPLCQETHRLRFTSSTVQIILDSFHLSVLNMGSTDAHGPHQGAGENADSRALPRPLGSELGFNKTPGAGRHVEVSGARWALHPGCTSESLPRC